MSFSSSLGERTGRHLVGANLTHLTVPQRFTLDPLLGGQWFCHVHIFRWENRSPFLHGVFPPGKHGHGQEDPVG